MERNIRANRLNGTRKMNVTNVPPIANTNALDANGRDRFMKVTTPLPNSQCVSTGSICQFPITFRSMNVTMLSFSHGAASEHEDNCLHPKKTGAEVMLALQANEADMSEEKKLFSTLIELLSYEKIIFNGTCAHCSHSVMSVDLVEFLLYSFGRFTNETVSHR